ncbi:hypothetical protein N2152v2_003912 [Parachlorella kessleri]
MTDSQVEQEHGTLAAYYQCLKTNKHFRWLNYVAVLTLVEEFSHSSLAISAVIVVHFLPSLLLAPVCGVVADRCNRVRVLLVTALLDAVAVAALALIQWPSQVPLLYGLLVVQFTCNSFYDPARKALIPLTVPQSQLHLAMTIDSFAWSLTGAVGASIGGVVASKLGNATCFLLDSLTYLVAAWCAYQLPRSLGRPGGPAGTAGDGHAVPDSGAAAAAAAAISARRQLKKRQSDLVLGLELGHLDSDSEQLEAGEAAGPARPHSANGLGSGEAAWLLTAGEARSASPDWDGSGLAAHRSKPGRRHPSLREGELPPVQPSGPEIVSQYPQYQSPGGREGLKSPARLSPDPRGVQRSPAPKAKRSDAEEGPLVALAQINGHSHGHSAAVPAAAAAAAGQAARGPGVVGAALGAVQEAWLAAWEGWRYLWGSDNRDVATLVTIKCCGSLLWGAIDVLNVRFSQMPAMQKLGDASVTLGLIFAVVGIACFLGPVMLNALVPPRPAALAWGVAASFAFMFVGFVIMLVASNISLLLLSTFVRSIGSATLWLYSTLLLQLRVPNAILGRMSAVEMALYTVTEAASSIFGGAAFDVLHLTLQQTLAVLAVLGGALTVLWVAFAAGYSRGRAAYAPVPADDIPDEAVTPA